MMKFNKKGDEKYLSIWNFIIWAVIGLIIVASILLFNSGQSDIRAEEARTLANRAIDCLNSGGNLDNSALNPNFDVFQSCSLNKVGFEDNGIYFLNITLEDVNSGAEKEIAVVGNRDFVVQCGISKGETQFAVCYNVSTRVTDSINSKQYYLRVFAGANSFGGNTK